MKLSYVILTYNRRDALLHTLAQVHQRPPFGPGDWETWVVDNGSDDGTAHAVAQAFPGVHLIRRPQNEGVWARHYAIEKACGEYVALLDDDSYPTGDETRRGVAFLDSNPRAGAVTGCVVLPDGSREASALPAVPANGALCLRRSVLRQIDGFRFCKAFGRQAEEYELAFRILEAGYELHRFEDLIYRHEKQTPGQRSTAQIHRLDLRNNLIVAHRYLPRDLRRQYQRDWADRYTAIARHKGFASAARRGRWEAFFWSLREPFPKTARPATIETVFELNKQSQTIAQWSKQHSIRRAVIADYSKNIYATHRACLGAGIDIQAITDNSPAFTGLSYRGVRIENDQQAIKINRPDGVVLSNVNPAQVDHRLEQLRKIFNGPILRLWQPRYLRDLAHTDAKDAAHTAAA